MPEAVTYYAHLTQEDGHWLVTFPDCRGCQTFGDTREDALTLAHEALQGWLEALSTRGDAFPVANADQGEPVTVTPWGDDA